MHLYISEMLLISNDILQISNYSFPLCRIGSVLNSEKLPGMRVEPAPNSEYESISELRLITRDHGRYQQSTVKPPKMVESKLKVIHMLTSSCNWCLWRYANLY